ncbi:TFIIB-type zinc ribbon-containing protein [Isoptericola sp. G70]|uniref:TFIIB-type zinc ribbon-containing protein n=1 Tax=Isoptericola sp. G70 TaxID=3376633 RepID=UPI003A81386B
MTEPATERRDESDDRQADGTPQVLRTDADAASGLSKCPRCGATQIALNIGSGMLRCSFCRDEWSTPNANEAFALDQGVDQLTGVTMGSGSADIVPSAEVVLTFKCGACGAEIVIDTASGTQARCHWCRNKLSMNEQVPNGAVPDMVLPFSLPKERAVEQIAQFVRKRRFFAHPRFREEFNPENVLGAYLPYMVVDVNAHASFTGQGEHQTRRYSVKVSDDRSETRYDADLYDVGRDFDVEIHDLAVVSSRERLDQRSSTSNNVINAIRPFDLENAVTYDSNYLAGFTSERRDTNVADLAPIVDAQSTDVARHAAHSTLGFYDRGVRWDHEQLTVKGQRWVSAYLPVWLYSYHQEKKDGRSMVHYVAVNGRTGSVMGSVPINYPRLLLTSAAVEVAGIVVGTIILALGAIL